MRRRYCNIVKLVLHRKMVGTVFINYIVTRYHSIKTSIYIIALTLIINGKHYIDRCAKEVRFIAVARTVILPIAV
jgi:hypothetical protein